MTRGSLVSIVIPARNEELNVPRLRSEVLEALERLPYRFEFLVIDNASTDRTGPLFKEICLADPRWKYVRFSRDFMLEASVAAGYRLASGDAIVVLYSDLQDPPAMISQLLHEWEEGYDVVYGIRTKRPGDPRWRNVAIRISYRLISWFSDVDIPPNAGDFRLISRRVRDALDACGEYNRYSRGLIAWLGFRQVGIPYERRPRTAGTSNLRFWQLLPFTLNALTNFSVRPLRMFTALGFGLLALALSAIPVYAVLYFRGRPPQGITTVIVLLLFAIGLNSLGIGVVGEYLGRTYSETKRRPLYVIDETVNLSIDRLPDELLEERD